MCLSTEADLCTGFAGTITTQCALCYSPGNGANHGPLKLASFPDFSPLPPQDEKALTFFAMVPQQWRLFWLINMVSLSFVLALAGVVYIGNLEALYQEDRGHHYYKYHSSLSFLSTSFIFIVNPAVTMFLSFMLSRSLRMVCEARDDEDEAGRKMWLWKAMRKSIIGATNAVRMEPCFYMVLFAWFGTSVVFFIGGMWRGDGSLILPYFFYLRGDDDDDDRDLEITPNTAVITAANGALAIGLLLMIVRSWRDQASAIVSVPGPQSSRLRRDESDETARGHHCPAGHIDAQTRQQRRSRVPPLFVGWGLGFWLGSFLYALGASWPEGDWSGAPPMVTVVGYVVLPLTFLLGVFMVADSSVYGLRVQRKLQPVADALKDEAGVIHWMMVTVLRDITFSWALYTSVTVAELSGLV